MIYKIKEGVWQAWGTSLPDEEPLIRAAGFQNIPAACPIIKGNSNTFVLL
jgi:hypothetical protein